MGVPMGRLRQLFLSAWLFSFLSMIPNAGSTIELGLTPGHVYGLWTHINESLLAYAKIISDDQEWLDALADLPPQDFSGKKHKDVLKLGLVLRARLDPTIPISRERPAWLFSYQPAGFGSDETEAITPSAVFLESMQILNGIVDVIVEKTGPEHMISNYYKPLPATGKVPSDAFSLVDLAVRRAEIIFASRPSQ